MPRGRRRGRDAGELEAALSQLGKQVGDGGAGAEPDLHPVLDFLGGRLGRELLLRLEIGGAHSGGIYVSRVSKGVNG
jgi:hypothetical protein